MTRKLTRTKDFELSIQIKNDGFIRPPHDFQRDWLLNRWLRETAEDLNALDNAAGRFVPGAERFKVDDLLNADLGDDEIMEDWQLPLAREMADIASRAAGDVLEVGFGLGVSATQIQDRGVRSHTIIECNESIVRRFERWREPYRGRDIRLVEGLWQDHIDDLGPFDSVLFHTFALNEEESLKFLSRSVTFAEHFFPHAAASLRDGGVFTYLTNEIDSLSRAHQRLILRYFRSYRVQIVPLDVPASVRDAWWADSMAVIEVVK